MKQTLLLILLLVTVTTQGQDKIESEIEESYNGASWTNSHGRNYVYDSNNNLISETYFNWDNTSGWTQSYKDNYTYNANNMATENISQDWEVNQWVNSGRNTYTYNSNEDLIGFINYDWDGTQWVNDYQGVLTYNNGLLLTIIFSEWDGTQWVNDERETRSYSGNNLTQILGEDWNGTQWVSGSRDVFTYNANNEITTIVDSDWDGSAWVEEDRVNYVLDGTGNRISETDIYNGTPEDKTEYNYDLTAQLSSFAHPFNSEVGEYLYEDFPYVNKILSRSEFNYDTSTNTYNPSSRTTYNYDSSLVLSNEKFNTITKISLYPNPTTNFIKLDGLNTEEVISIYNVLGLKVLEKTITRNDEIDIQQFSNGIYFLKFKNGYTLKFLKK